MSHPTELLSDYALCMLEPAERRRLEAHLAGCRRCQAELQSYQGALVRLVEALPETSPPTGAWEKIAQRLEPVPATRPPVRRGALWRGWAAAAGLVLALGGAWWGYGEYRQGAQLQAEQRRVARWLSQPQVEMQPVHGRAGERLGGLLLLPDGRALFVLSEPPAPGRAYQAWGHRGDVLEPLELSARPVFEVRWQGFDTLYLSLEPESGSPRPTEPLSSIGL